MPHPITTPHGFDAFYRKNTKTVLRWVIRLGGAGLDAEDVAQDVFQVAFKKAHTFVGEDATPWLYGITRNVVANARRRARFRRMFGLDSAPPPVDPRPGADEILEQLGRRRMVQVALEELSFKHREALVLVDLEERTAPEAASCIGVSVGTLYSRLHYARKAFAVALKPHEDALRTSRLRTDLGVNR
jgi:RNA polymerase sigma-70 factor (ECF subfamily)